jgi:hypothetical protein
MADNPAMLTWLVIIGVCSLTQTLVLLGALTVVWRRMKAAEARIHAMEREILAPALARVELTLRDLQDAADRLRRADETIREWMNRGADLLSLATGRAQSQLRPVLGLAKGIRAAARAWTRGRTPTGGARVTPMPIRTKEGDHAHVWTK